VVLQNDIFSDSDHGLNVPRTKLGWMTNKWLDAGWMFQGCLTRSAGNAKSTFPSKLEIFVEIWARFGHYSSKPWRYAERMVHERDEQAWYVHGEKVVRE
jgi:hypothetical protein